MPSAENDTIAAVCTAPGGALAILRISGPEALRILNCVTAGPRPVSAGDARKALLRRILDREGERCLAIFMPGPASYTGEDVAEIQCHGGDFAPNRLLKSAVDAGARPAEGGEFTRRAFLNGKIDLTQAEAVADMISARSEAAGRLAERQMAGRLGDRIRLCRETLLHVLSEVESRMDFPEEELDWLPSDELAARIRGTKNQLARLLETAREGAVIRSGIRLVLAGAPNAGKSSLMNALLGYDRAIVTAAPGTTRDTVEETLSLEGLCVRVSDTAGLRDCAEEAERLGVERTRKMLGMADVIVWLLDISRSEEIDLLIRQFEEERPAGIPVIPCWNKCDLPHGGLPAVPGFEGTPLSISTRTGEGLDELKREILRIVLGSPDRHEPESAVSARHADWIRKALPELEAAEQSVLREEWELAAGPIRESLHSRGIITGETADPDVLDEIFSRFCIGK